MSIREILEIPQNESINLLIDNAVRVGGAEPTGTIQIDANGLYNVAPYAAANVNVPEPSGSISITENGTVDVKNYASANVNVPQGVFPTGSLSINENGTYDVTNYAGANVNVPQGVFPTGSLSITENGTYDVTNYADVVVTDIGKARVYEQEVSITLTEDVNTIRIPHHLGRVPNYFRIYTETPFENLPNATIYETKVYRFPAILFDDLNASPVWYKSGTGSNTGAPNLGGYYASATLVAMASYGTATYRSGLTYKCRLLAIDILDEVIVP